MTGGLWTAPGETARGLSTLTEEERYRYFDQLQARLVGVWDAMLMNHEDESVVVIPSLTLEGSESLGSGTMMQAYEERFLFLLILLREPRLRMVYVTSMPIAPEIVEYYLALLPGVIPSHARARLSLIAVNDAAAVSLSAKLLARPRLLQRIAALIPNPMRSHLVPYNTTELERDVAISLGIPMYGAARKYRVAVPRPAANPAAPTHGWPRSDPSRAVASCSPSSTYRIRSGSRTCTRSTTLPMRWSRCAPSGRRWTARS